MDIEKIKAEVCDRVAAHRPRLDEISHSIHSHPELGFEESQAVEWLTAYLEENGFSVERGICQIPTAFRASYGKGRPAIAILAEYDALPELGHACGHNIIAASAVGAGAAAKAAIDRYGGRVTVIGTPAEEMQGGKIIMAQRGAFKGFDATMMVHPGSRDVATISALACQTLEVEFFGKAVHAASRPEEGINALEAMILAFTAVNSLRQHIRDKSRIHGIITDGGEAANVVPDHSAATFIARAEDDSCLDELKKRVISCFAGAAAATGARLEHRWSDTRYATMRNNLALAGLFQHNMASLRDDVALSNEDNAFGSTDMGNVSHLVPAIHPTVAMVPPGVGEHSIQFAAAAASEAGSRALFDAAKAMAMTIVDLVADPENIKQATEEFNHRK